MSETVRNDISNESICTVIENSNDFSSQSHKDEAARTLKLNGNSQSKSSEVLSALESTDNEAAPNDSFSDSFQSSCDTTAEISKPSLKLKKSVSFDPNDEKVRKFITGEPIIDQQNPFKQHGNSLGRKKKTPPPVPTKRSTLSVRKTVTQQLREREREKEKERERLKNETNNRKTNSNGVSALPSPDDYISTEEVLKQSKYVKTYIKNPDPYFVYDPTVLARIKFDELREIADKKPVKKLKLTNQTRDRLKDLKNKQPNNETHNKAKVLTFKKCSKPNYPELSDIKIKVGTEPDDNYFNPAEVTKNAKKFDERAKKLHMSSDDDLDEVDGPLTKSESSDEVTANSQKETSDKEMPNGHDTMNGDSIEEQPATGTFTNTIKSKEFQAYLEKKGLTLIPKKIPNGAQTMYANGAVRANQHITFRAPERIQFNANDSMDPDKNSKKPSVFQRLLSNSIFASRRKTLPKETVPTPRSLGDARTRVPESSTLKPAALKRVVLERQSYHGRPRASNLLGANESNELKSQIERSRRSFAGGDDLSISISSALTNAEYDDDQNSGAAVKQGNNTLQRKPELLPKPIAVAKPPRRTLSRDRLTVRQVDPQQQSRILKPTVQRAHVPMHVQYTLPREQQLKPELQLNGDDGAFMRTTLERQSLIPKRTTPVNDKRQIFGRTASMDRNEILKRTTAHGLQPKPESTPETNFNSDGPQIITSTPIRNAVPNVEHHRGNARDTKTYPPIARKPIIKPPPGVVFVDQQEWERLRAIKERTDRELYYRVLQQQQLQQRQDAENIYEHLPINQVLVSQLAPQNVYQQQQRLPQGNFIRGSPQRNTFSGITRNRQAKIIDGRAVLNTNLQPLASQANPTNLSPAAEQSLRSQSVLDDMIQQQRARNNARRGYESDTETAVVLRRRIAQADELPQRRIGGILTREEILQKVKEFCRKSINKTPTNQPPTIYEKKPISTEISPVSYASVETQQRAGSRMYAAPQVPQRMQSLPEQFIPIRQEVFQEQNTSTSSPIYAHVVKRSSLQSNQSELYDSPQRPFLVRHESDAQMIYVANADAGIGVVGGGGGGGTLQCPESAFSPPTQYVIVDSDKISPRQLINYPQTELYAQPQYIRPHQLQPMPGGTYGYITVREPMPPLQQIRTRLHDGRSTPLILDRSSQQASQIYWTPQHQRLQQTQQLQQHTGLLPVQISPRYSTTKQQQSVYPVPAPRTLQTNRAAVEVQHVDNNIPLNQQQQQAHFSTIMRTNTPTKQHLMRQASTAATSSSEYITAQQPYEWESGSDSGEVQRIMEQQHQRNSSGEFRKANIFRNLKTKLTRLVSGSKR